MYCLRLLSVSVWGSVLGAAGAEKVCSGCRRVHVNLQENSPSVLCGASAQRETSMVKGTEGCGCVALGGGETRVSGAGRRWGVDGHRRACPWQASGESAAADIR